MDKSSDTLEKKQGESSMDQDPGLLAALQEADCEALERLLVHYKKESLVRREKKFDHYLKTAKTLYSSIVERHKELNEKGELLSTSAYVTEGRFEIAEETYGQLIIKIDADQRKVKDKSKNVSSEAVKNRGIQIALIQRFMAINEQVESDDPSREEATFLRDRLAKYHDCFVHWCGQTNDEQLEGENHQINEEVLEMFARIDLILKSFETVASSTTEPVTSDHGQGKEGDSVTAKELFNILKNSLKAPKENIIKLPQLEIPCFDGTLRKWVQFRSIYESSIHNNNNLDSVIKLRYLQSLLIGDAAAVIAHLDLSNSNYITAWNLVTQRYNNERVLINNYLERLLSIPAAKNDKSAEIRAIIDETKEIYYSLQNIGENPWNSFFLYITCKRLPRETLLMWEQSLVGVSTMPSFKRLEQFLEQRMHSLAAIEENDNFSSLSSDIVKYNNSKCICCKGDHRLYQCTEFVTLTPASRVRLIRDNFCCELCLNRHDNSTCTFKWRCKYCKGPHNSLLHVDNVVGTAGCINTPSVVLLATAQIRLYSTAGVPFMIKALIDQGSMISVISERIMAKLNWSRRKDSTLVKGLGDQPSNSRGITDFCLDSVVDRSRTFRISAIILPSVTANLPSVSTSGFDEFSHLQLADPEYYKGGMIDLIIGAELVKELMLTDVVKGSLLAQHTHLGWILSGSCHGRDSGQTKNKWSYSVVESRDFSLQKFWETEEKVVERNELSDEENACEKFYRSTTYRNSSGRYVCRLPFRSGVVLGRSRNIAVANFLQLERRFARDPLFKKRYVEGMNEYFSLGHAVPVKNEQQVQQSYYMPHLAVIKESSITTKTRIVFNASSPSSNKVSLNDALMVGSSTQRDIVDKIISFRLFKIVFICDIEKMYRQIEIHPADRNFQKFVWRSSYDQPIRDFCLTTVTFGTASAPFTAIRTIKQIAIDQKDNYPVGSRILSENCYVDDIHFGCDNLEEARRGRNEVIGALQTASFDVRKWASNRQEIVNELPEEVVNSADKHKFLGIVWNNVDDILNLNNVDFEDGFKITKRLILTNIAKIYDPIGWYQPVVVKAKILLQELWKADLNWDEEVPNSIASNWVLVKESLNYLKNIRIPRWFGLAVKSKVMLHGFADASQVAYGAVVYICYMNNTSLLIAKSRVAPVKQISIPRLELKAALLLTDLMKRAQNVLIEEGITSICSAWSDSRVALSWIGSSPERWTPFVRNRVATIQEMLPGALWQYVSTDRNPADLISRGCSADELMNSSFINGPDWISPDCNEFKDVNDDLQDDVMALVEEERLKKCKVVATVVRVEDNSILNLSRAISSVDKINRVMVYVIRAINKMRKITTITVQEISIEELRIAEYQVIRCIQRIHFNNEINSILKNEEVKNNNLAALRPFVDQSGILRVGGRIKRAALPFNTCHPIILPGSEEYTDALIRRTHSWSMHAGVDLTLNLLRSKYWVIHGRSVVKRVIRSCIKCFRAHPKTMNPLMADLPESRVTLTKPFDKTGVDFCGPVKVRISVGRGMRTTKSYIAVFVCMSTKAMHLEMVSALTKDAFIAALKRMISRRGTVTQMFSDNGSNFVGAFRKLVHLSAELKAFELEWSFIPPRAPNFGGLWESGVKVVKSLIRRSFGEQLFTFEEMQTILCQVEMCVNSRPLCGVADDFDEIDALTPQHFLTGVQTIALAEKDVSTEKQNLLTRWELVKQKYQIICLRFKTEYLAQLQQRAKWTRKSNNIKLHQLVIVKEDELPLNSWPLGRVVKLHPGNDGIVRVVTVMTNNGEFKRAVRKLCPLPIEN